MVGSHSYIRTAVECSEMANSSLDKSFHWDLAYACSLQPKSFLVCLRLWEVKPGLHTLQVLLNVSCLDSYVAILPILGKGLSSMAIAVARQNQRTIR